MTLRNEMLTRQKLLFNWLWLDMEPFAAVTTNDDGHPNELSRLHSFSEHYNAS